MSQLTLEQRVYVLRETLIKAGELMVSVEAQAFVDATLQYMNENFPEIKKVEEYLNKPLFTPDAT